VNPWGICSNLKVALSTRYTHAVHVGTTGSMPPLTCFGHKLGDI